MDKQAQDVARMEQDFHTTMQNHTDATSTIQSMQRVVDQDREHLTRLAQHVE